MAKVSRTVLKSLVKECLVEILSEGLVSANQQVQESKKVSAKKKPVARKKKVIKEEIIPETIKGMTDDPLMQSIFADTARTTLQEQTAAERNQTRIPADSYSRVADENDPTELFGEAANNWAHLAFSEKKPAGQHK